MDKKNDKNELKIIKIVVIGDVSIGKTALIRQYVESQFKNTLTTLGIHFSLKTISIGNELISLQIYDTPGQEKLAHIPKNVYKSMNGIIIAFAIDNFPSFNKAMKWYDTIKQDCKQETYFFLVGCKCDLEANRQVSFMDAEQYASQNNFNYIETSALNEINVNQPFETLSRLIISNPIVDYGLPTFKLPFTQTTSQQEDKSTCC